jgi:hypothetical protein
VCVSPEHCRSLLLTHAADWGCGCRELFATLAQFFVGDTTPAARSRMRQLRRSDRAPLALIDAATSTSGLDRLPTPRAAAPDAVGVPVADDSATRGPFPDRTQLENYVLTGAYGVAATAMPTTTILGRAPPTPITALGAASSSSSSYMLDPALTAVKDRATWTPRERALAVADSLLERLAALEAAWTDVDESNIVSGDAVPAPPGSGMTGTAAHPHAHDIHIFVCLFICLCVCVCVDIGRAWLSSHSLTRTHARPVCACVCLGK